MPQVSLIDTQEKWERTASVLAQEPELALDTESNSLHAYRERVCLIQIATSRETFLLDPLAVKDLSTLGKLLAGPAMVKVLHGSDYDLRCLDRDYGFSLESLFDTEIAARFLGERSPNLAAVLENFLGVAIPKSRKLQQSDWGRRPLSPLAREYAGNDVRYLVKLAQQMRSRLERLGRLEWVQEEFLRLERVRYSPPNQPETAFLQVKGSDRLGHRALAVLRELFLWRENEAEHRDCPPFRVMGNEVLLDLARTAASNASAYPAQDIGISSRMSRQMEEGIRAAIKQGLAGPEYHRPPTARNGEPWTPEARARLQRLKDWRNRRGNALGLDPSLLWPAASLERLALLPQDWRPELPGDETVEVRAWQRREFGQELRDILS